MAMYAPLLSPLPGTLDLQSPSSTLFERSMGALVSNFKGTVGLLSTENLGSLPPPTGTAEDDNGNSASTLVNVTSSDLDANKENQHPQDLKLQTAAKDDVSYSTNVSMLAGVQQPPSFDFIVGSFLESLDTLTATSQKTIDAAFKSPDEFSALTSGDTTLSTPIEYNPQMLMVDLDARQAPVLGVANDMGSSDPFAEPVLGASHGLDSDTRRQSLDESESQNMAAFRQEFIRQRHSDPPAFYAGAYYGLDGHASAPLISPSSGSLFSSNLYGSAENLAAPLPPANGTSALFNFGPGNMNFYDPSVMHDGASLNDYSVAQPDSSNDLPTLTPSNIMNGSYPCTMPRCNARPFMSYNALRAHLASHSKKLSSKDKPFKCEMCSQTFSRSHDLKRHYYVHTDAKPYKCRRCDKGFSRRDALKRHEKAFKEGKKVHCIVYDKK